VSCRWVGSNQPRVLVGRHTEDCPGDCTGCQPCGMDHCRVCGIEHAAGACPTCLGAARDDLVELLRMCGDLPDEVEVRGVEGEAMNLLGPIADPEARQHWTASVLAGRIVPVDCEAHDLDDVKAWLDIANHERHPLLVIGTWAMTYRDAFEHDEPTGRVTVWDEAGYLGRNLTEMGDYPHIPFEDFGRDLRRCVAHMERVLHDGEQIDQGAPCMTCGRPLERTWGRTSDEDGWRCPKCHTTSNDAQYRFAVKADYIDHADWLTDVDMAARTGVKSGTVRVWAQREFVTRRIDSGRVLYSVADVMARREAPDLAC
jgi:hypothetical protein